MQVYRGRINRSSGMVRSTGWRPNTATAMYSVHTGNASVPPVCRPRLRGWS